MLDRIIRFSIYNKVVIAVMTIALIAWGLWSALRLPIDAVPDITNNQVQIITVSPTLAGQEVEQLVTFPVEQSIANLPGLEEVRSISRFGLSVVTAVFEEDVDIYFARQLVDQGLKAAIEVIPEGIGTPEIAPLSTGLGEVYQYIIRPKEGSEDRYTSHDLREMQDWIVARQLYGTPGVAEVNSFGGELRQYEVAIDPYRLQALGVSVSDIFSALEANNQNTGGAYIDKKPNAYFIRGVGMVTNLDDVRQIHVRSNPGDVPLLIGDVAEVRFGSAVRYGALTYNGEVDAVGGVVMMLKGANSSEVVSRVKEKIPTIQASLPEDIVIEPYLDRTDLIGRAMSTVERNLIEGALIVIFVLVIFLGNLRAGLIVASTIPLSLLFALGMMNVFGVSANLMSLGAIDFGLIVDGAVIVVEATMHHLGLRKTTHVLSRDEMNQEVYHSASKIRSSAAFGEIIILIVYLPILTLIGVEGKMFRPMAQTVGFAILGALILSMTYIPMMSALFLSRKPKQGVSLSDRMMARLEHLYTPLLQRAIALRRWCVGGVVVAFVGALMLFGKLGGEFIPQLNEGDFAFHCILPQGSSLSQSFETSTMASRLALEFDEVRMVIGKTGAAEVPTDPMPPEGTDLMILLHPQEEWTSGRSYDELAHDLLEHLSVIPGVFFEENQPIQMRFNELMTGVRQDVAVKIFGENLDTLRHYAERVSQVISEVEGTTTAQVEQISGLPQINVEYDRQRMAAYGVNIRDANDILSTAFAGRSAGVVFENERRFDLVVRLDSAFRTSLEDVAMLRVPTASGHQIPLTQIAQVGYRTGPAQISREGGRRRIVVGFNIAGRDTQSVVGDIQQRLAQEVKLPTGYYITYGGQFENLQKASRRLTLAVPVALLLIFALLYFTFSSVKQAALIFTAIPMSAIGGVLALWMRDMPFSISAGVGFIALFGVAVLNGIVLISTFNQLHREGVEDLMERVLQATRMRLRPVLMTGLVASLGFLPMALSTSAGAEVQRPLATVVIGGLFTATLLTLFVLPMLYVMMERGIARLKRQRSTALGGKTLAIALLLASSALPALAETPPRKLSLDEVIAIALERNASIQASKAEVQAASKARGTAYDLPKLSLSSQVGQYSSVERDNSFSIEQSLPFPTTFVARRKLATAERDAKGATLAKDLIELKGQLRQLYHRALYLEGRLQLLGKLDSLYQDFDAIASLRYEAGDVSKVDVSTARARRGQVRLQLLEGQTALASTYAELAALMHYDEPFVLLPLSVEEPSGIDLSRLLDSATIGAHVNVQELRQQATMAQRQRQLALHEALPELTLGYTNQSLIGDHTIGGVEQWYGAGKRFEYFSFGIAIPLNLYATSSRVRSLRHQQRAADLRVLQAERQLRSQAEQALMRYRQSQRQYRYTLEEALPSASEIISTAQLGYRAGEISYLEYIYAIETATQLRESHLESTLQLREAQSALLSLLNQ